MNNINSTFTEFTPYERQIFIAELYHNAWYSQDRFEMLYDLFNKWQEIPVKECKFMITNKNSQHEEQNNA
jgi:hypothetical protein